MSICNPNPCLNSGVCTVGNSGTFVCACPAGFIGTRCETYSSEHFKNKLFEIWQPKLTNASFFNEKDCSPPCVFGKCVEQLNNPHKCLCIPGYIGPACDTDIHECASNPCQNIGVCTEPFINMYLCSCQPGFSGPNCENTVKVCASNPCMNQGVCGQIAANEFKCYCVPGFTGLL